MEDIAHDTYRRRRISEAKNPPAADRTQRSRRCHFPPVTQHRPRPVAVAAPQETQALPERPDYRTRAPARARYPGVDSITVFRLRAAGQAQRIGVARPHPLAVAEFRESGRLA